MAAILTLALLLDTLGYQEAATAVEDAVGQALRDGVTTADLGGRSSTSEVGDFLARATAGS
jgi:isocitrate/isopropylmalate dehydrogenase